jgi:hypothetical protein
MIVFGSKWYRIKKQFSPHETAQMIASAEGRPKVKRATNVVL